MYKGNTIIIWKKTDSFVKDKNRMNGNLIQKSKGQIRNTVRILQQCAIIIEYSIHTEIEFHVPSLLSFVKDQQKTTHNVIVLMLYKQLIIKSIFAQNCETWRLFLFSADLEVLRKHVTVLIIIFEFEKVCFYIIPQIRPSTPYIVIVRVSLRFHEMRRGGETTAVVYVYISIFLVFIHFYK